MRKYALTAYKFLDIGIVVGSVFHVQIVIIEATTCSYLMLHEDDIERHADIERLMQSTILLSSPIQDLNVELVKIYDTNNMKLTLNGTCFYKKSTTAFLI